MRFVALALIALCLPLFITLLRGQPRRRDLALTALGAAFFFSGQLQIDAALVTWPLWPGTVRGVQLSPIEMLAIALIATRSRSPIKLPFLWLFGAQFLVLTLSLLVSQMPMATSFSIYQFLRVTIVFIAVGGELTRPSALTALLKGLSMGLMVQAGFVISQKLSGVVQARGTMDHQNLLGVMTELVLFPLIAAVLEGQKHWLMRAGIVAGGIILVGGGSRGALAMAGGAAIILAAISVIRNPSPHKMKFVGLGALLILIFTPLGMMTLHERFGSVSVLAEEGQRSAMERAAKAMAADHPLGVGANLYTFVSNQSGYADRAGVAWNTETRAVSVHNIYLLYRAETGLHGEIVLILILAVPAITGFIFAFRNRKSKAGGYVLGSSVAITTVAIHSTLEYSLGVYSVMSLLFINHAIIAGVIRATRLDSLRRPKLREKGSMSRTMATRLPRFQPSTDRNFGL